MVEYLYLGGIERLLQQLSDQTGESTELSFLSYETDQLSGIGLEMHQKGKHVITTKKMPGRDWRLVRRIQKVIKEQNIDVIHTHDFGPMEYAVIAKILNPKVRLVHTQHTLHHFISNRKYTFFFQIASYFYHTIAAVSQHVEETLLSHCPKMKKTALRTIPNGVNTQTYAPTNTKSTEPEKRLKFVSVSRISPEKNFDYLLATCLMLKQKGIDFTLHHAGTTENKQELDRILKFIQENELENNIFLHGFVSDTNEILKLGDIFLSASHTEGHPVAVLEAMSAGKICLVSDIKPHHELNEEALIFFDKNVPQSLCDLLQANLENLKTNDSEIERKKQIARTTVLEKFSLQQMVKNYVELYA